jgi:hypothetical protein
VRGLYPSTPPPNPPPLGSSTSLARGCTTRGGWSAKIASTHPQALAPPSGSDSRSVPAGERPAAGLGSEPWVGLANDNFDAWWLGMSADFAEDPPCEAIWWRGVLRHTF